MSDDPQPEIQDTEVADQNNDLDQSADGQKESPAKNAAMEKIKREKLQFDPEPFELKTKAEEK